MTAASAKAPLGRLVQVDLRSFWAHEALELTPWLEENIGLLSEALGLELEVEERECGVGPFSADLLCRDTRDSRPVIIENQLERTDHIHLGQALTYAGGLDAFTVVWIAPHFRDEHRAALDWLNRATSESYSFFGVEIELWRIGDSPAAPRFNVVSQPNDWAKTLTQTVGSATTDTKMQQVRYWQALKDLMEREWSPVRFPRASPAHWISTGVGRSGIGILAIASRYNSADDNWSGGENRIELNLFNDPQRSLLHQLLARRDEIEAAIGEPLTWHDPQGTKSAKVYVRRPGDVTDPTEWLVQHRWLKEKLELFHRVFRPIVMELQTEPLASAGEVDAETPT
jgi:hypothetical protein